MVANCFSVIIEQIKKMIQNSDEICMLIVKKNYRRAFFSQLLNRPVHAFPILFYILNLISDFRERERVQQILKYFSGMITTSVKYLFDMLWFLKNFAGRGQPASFWRSRGGWVESTHSTNNSDDFISII